MKAAPYPAYKASGATWLGNVPSHWTVKSIKWESPVLRGASPRPIDDPLYFDEDGEYAWVRISDVTEAGAYLEGTEQVLSDIGSKLSVRLQPGSLFLSIAGSVGKPCITRIKCCIHDGFVYFPRWKSDQKFLYYVFASGEPYKGLGKMGTQLNLNTDTVGGVVIGLPGIKEQQTIVRFLDAQTAQIDALVAKKLALVDRLKEKRRALIARTVTSGLPPQVADAFGLGPHSPMKASGVEWFGDVPGHWTVKQLKWAVMFQRGHDLPSEQREEGTVPLVTSAGVSATHSVAAAKGPGIVTGRYGTIGQFHLVFEDYWPLNTTLYTVDLYGNDPHFLLFLLEHLSPLVILHSVKSAVPGVDRNDLHPTIIALPPREEQRAIAAYLDGEISRLDQLAECVRKVMTRLTEYRQALITSAVTGKIDVRERSVELEAA